MNQRIGFLIYREQIFDHCKTHYAFIIAMCLHFAIIYGLGNKFIIHHPAITPLLLEITLASKPSLRPETADYLADANQEGGGMSLIKNIPQLAAQTLEGIGLPFEHNDEQSPLINTINPNSANDTAANDTPAVEQNLNNQIFDLAAAEAEMANLSEIVARQQEAWAKRPRKRHISAATFEARDAQYLELWRQHIEKVGNENYPREAIQQKLGGELRVLVAINPDGSLYDVQIRRSSGSQTLDEAALHIVRLAAPFEPLTSAMAKDTDILEIIRTWQFSEQGLKTD